MINDNQILELVVVRQCTDMSRLVSDMFFLARTGSDSFRYAAFRQPGPDFPGQTDETLTQKKYHQKQYYRRNVGDKLFKFPEKFRNYYQKNGPDDRSGKAVQPPDY